MNWVIRCNYGDNSIAVISYLADLLSTTNQPVNNVYVVYIDTGWAAKEWSLRVTAGEQYVKAKGFIPVNISSNHKFSDLVLKRQQFPSVKFQWCASFLKGLPFLQWLDERDLSCEWQVILPKRQSQYIVKLEEFKSECEFHGDRKVWHPILQMSDLKCKQLVESAGFKYYGHRSLECQPCVHCSDTELAKLKHADKNKLIQLEQLTGKSMFKRIPNSNALKTNANLKKSNHLNLGCGDPFGCGL